MTSWSRPQAQACHDVEAGASVIRPSAAEPATIRKHLASSAERGVRPPIAAGRTPSHKKPALLVNVALASASNGRMSIFANLRGISGSRSRETKLHRGPNERRAL